MIKSFTINETLLIIGLNYHYFLTCETESMSWWVYGFNIWSTNQKKNYFSKYGCSTHHRHKSQRSFNFSQTRNMKTELRVRAYEKKKIRTKSALKFIGSYSDDARVIITLFFCSNLTSTHINTPSFKIYK